jgi:hypothetical protein
MEEGIEVVALVTKSRPIFQLKITGNEDAEEEERYCPETF